MPFITAIEPFTESIVCGIVGAFSSSYLFGTSVLLFGCVHLVIWFVGDWFLVQGFTQKSYSITKFLFAWLFREILAIPIFIYAIFGGNQVIWRGRGYRLKFGGLVVPAARS
jgi:ceramide glucosyltransferase